ncbi:hypothetical protein [Candidatus Neptunochlamydia vexilliferae]|uniref:Secreted protein n=1 Tax=Candidatus Neptunichlamydia vexilliferae TaxID=1651774 RepID=A0ABS0AZ27_9BACT|nr:hypothetical protein [Candidatus Neptunochlamydia vexilliferae]MBF5059387.1 hypothetical protein [Candidatus Neptunochlamydia vexilliferae]
MIIRTVFLMLVAISTAFAGKASKEEDAGSSPTLINETNSFNSYHYNNRMVVFNLVRLCYERTKLDALHVGVDAWLTWAVTNKNARYHPSPFGFIGEAEVHLGYNYHFGMRNFLTPIVGIGVFGDFRNNYCKIRRRHSYWYSDYPYSYKRFSLTPVLYGTFGILYTHEFNSIFNLGLNLKGIVGGDVNKRTRWGNPVLGFDLTIPIIFRFGKYRHWEFRLEPFNIYLNGRQVERSYFGCRNMFGYRF